MESNTTLFIILALVLVGGAIFLYMRSRRDHGDDHGDDHGQTNVEHQNKTGGDLVLFFAPWCGHCKDFEPVWVEFVKNFNGYNGIKLVKINGAEDQKMATLHAVSQFPTIKFCPHGVESADGVIYPGERSIQGLSQFLQQMT